MVFASVFTLIQCFQGNLFCNDLSVQVFIFLCRNNNYVNAIQYTNYLTTCYVQKKKKYVCSIICSTAINKCEVKDDDSQGIPGVMHGMIIIETTQIIM